MIILQREWTKLVLFEARLTKNFNVIKTLIKVKQNSTSSLLYDPEENEMQIFDFQKLSERFECI